MGIPATLVSTNKFAAPAAPIHAPCAAVFPDSRPGAVAQRAQQVAIDASPRVRLQQQAHSQLQASPRLQLPVRSQPAALVQQKANRTGLPDQLKAGVETLSGHSLDNVEVHYDSAQPAQLQAHAYAQGTDIHLAPGQQEHLPHEAWHVAQQKQGRVPATHQLKGVGLNDDSTLEREADVMGQLAHHVGFAAAATPPAAQSFGSAIVQAKDYTDEEMAEFNKKRAADQTTELEKLKEQRLVSKFFGAEWAAPTPPADVMHVGVTFRTDSNGKAHTTHDLAAVEAMNSLGLKFRVEGVTLPRGASGGVSPLREASAGDLDGIDVLYVPGGPTANDTQTGSGGPEDAAEREFNRVKPLAPAPAPLGEKPTKKQIEKHKQDSTAYNKLIATSAYRKTVEHTGRASYELRLIEIAKTKGLPIMAVCAGSWRLLESYGGEVRTLPKAERAIHKDDAHTWDINHDISITPGSMLGGMVGRSGPVESTNSTHWAVASTVPSERLEEGPDQLKDGPGIKRTPDGKLMSDSKRPPREILAITARAEGMYANELDPERPAITLTNPDGATRPLVPPGMVRRPFDTSITLPDPKRPAITLTNPEGDTQPLVPPGTIKRPGTVEGFESRSGAPHLGLQWHPEAYLPGMLSAAGGSPEVREGSSKIFKSMAQAGRIGGQRRQVTAELHARNPETRAYALLEEYANMLRTGHMVGAGNLYREVLALVPLAEFSDRMNVLNHEADQAASKAADK